METAFNFLELAKGASLLAGGLIVLAVIFSVYHKQYYKRPFVRRAYRKNWFFGATLETLEALTIVISFLAALLAIAIGSKILLDTIPFLRSLIYWVVVLLLLIYLAVMFCICLYLTVDMGDGLLKNSSNTYTDALNFFWLLVIFAFYSIFTWLPVMLFALHLTGWFPEVRNVLGIPGL